MSNIKTYLILCSVYIRNIFNKLKFKYYIKLILTQAISIVNEI